MVITKVQYTESEKKVLHIVYNNDTSVKISTSVGNMENSDWQNVKEWVEDGNTIAEED